MLPSNHGDQLTAAEAGNAQYVNLEELDDHGGVRTAVSNGVGQPC